MKKRAIAMLLIAGACAAVFTSQAAPQKYKAGVAQLSPATTDTYKKLVTAVVEASGNTVDIQVLPFARCMYSIETKDIDLVSPTAVLPDKGKWAALKYDYATAEVFKIVFVLYSNKAKPVDAAELKKGNPKGYRIETDASHVDYFPFPIAGSTSFEASLKKVDAGTIDGFVFAQPSCDAVVKAQGLKNVRRQYYDSFPATFLIAKGGRGGALDKALAAGIAAIKANGKYEEILGAYTAGASKFVDWQP